MKSLKDIFLYIQKAESNYDINWRKSIISQVFNQFIDIKQNYQTIIFIRETQIILCKLMKTGFLGWIFFLFQNSSGVEFLVLLYRQRFSNNADDSNCLKITSTSKK